MKKSIMKNLILVLFTLIFIFGSSIIYKNEEKNFINDTSVKLHEQAHIVKEYFEIVKSLIFTLKNSLENNLEIYNNTNLTHPSLNTIEYYKKENIYYIKTFLDKEKTVNSSLNGIGKIEHLSHDNLKEINSALFLNPIFKTSLESYLDIEWIYYTSKNKFMYLAPTDFKMDDKFLNEQYKKDFWQDAIPQNNKSLGLILTSLYMDGAGKGLLTTLSIPVIHKNEFTGVLSIDIGLKALKKMIERSITRGDIYLLNNKDEILAAEREFILGEKLVTHENTKNVKNTKFIIINLFDNKMKLIHSIKKKEEFIYLMGKAASKILLLLFILVMIYMTYHLVTLLKKINTLACIDYLTSLLNRRSMRKESKTLIDIAIRYDHNLSFLLLDIDNFKKVNDTYGHSIGDKTLQEISRVLKEHTRNADLVSRYGGEEFLICLSNTNHQEAFVLAERIRKKVSKIKIKELKEELTISIGCVEYQKDEKLDHVINRADVLMYKAKNNGRNQTQKE